MLRSKTTILAIALPLVLAACGSSEDGEPMTPLVESFEAEVTELDELAEAHDGTVAAAADLDAIAAEESAYAIAADEIYEHIEHVLGEMAECHHNESPPDLTDLGAALTDLEDELADHATTMAAAADVAAATTEEQRHQSAVVAIVAVFDSGHDALHETAGDYMCHGGGHTD